MIMKRLPLALCLILHTFWGNANASLTSESDELPATVTVNITHTKHPCMRGLAHISFFLVSGETHQALKQMNVHSPPTSPRDDFIVPRKKNPLKKSYKPGSYTPETYKKTYEISEHHFQNGFCLTASFFMEEVRLKFTIDPKTRERERDTIQKPWQGLAKISIADLRDYPLELAGGLTLQSLYIDIKWENMDVPTSVVTPHYE